MEQNRTGAQNKDKVKQNGIQTKQKQNGIKLNQFEKQNKNK